MWRLPRTTLMHLLWTWLLLESQKGSHTLFLSCIWTYSYQGFTWNWGNRMQLKPTTAWTPIMKGQTIPCSSPHGKSDITVSGTKDSDFFTENTVVIPASVFRSLLHGSASSEVERSGPSWGGLLTPPPPKKTPLSRSCGGMWSLLILSHFCCCQSQFLPDEIF